MLKKIMIIAVAVFSVVAFSQITMARDFAEIYTDCGLGAMIAPRSDAVAAVTNVTWDLGTTAVSSNITSDGTCQGGQQRMAAFINESYEFLEKELASGSGAYLDTLTAMTGCDQQVHKNLTDALRSDFADTVADPGYSGQSHFEQSQGLYDLLYKQVDGDFSGSCYGNNS